jgi:hypothetical protein
MLTHELTITIIPMHTCTLAHTTPAAHSLTLTLKSSVSSLGHFNQNQNHSAAPLRLPFTPVYYPTYRLPPSSETTQHHPLRRPLPHGTAATTAACARCIVSTQSHALKYRIFALPFHFSSREAPSRPHSAAARLGLEAFKARSRPPRISPPEPPGASRVPQEIVQRSFRDRGHPAGDESSGVCRCPHRDGDRRRAVSGRGALLGSVSLESVIASRSP